MTHSPHWLEVTLLLALGGCPGPRDRCAVDTDCGDGQVCLDLGTEVGYDPQNVCVPASCDGPTSCDAGEECLLVAWNDGCGLIGERLCTSPIDTCRADEDCGDPEMACLPDGVTGGLTCQTEVVCAIGRPLEVGGAARTAPHVARSDWADPSAVALPGPALAAVLASHWRAVAAMEHASVASFARFSLELLALGAPAELLRDAHEAGLDEIRHAALAFGLASRFAGEPVGPGPLALDGVAPATTPAAVLDALIAEACVGETVGAALARAQAGDARDPALSALLQGIADDEARHAALAWRTARWMCATWPHLAERLAPAVTEAGARLVAQLSAGPDGPPGHGMLGPKASSAVALRVIDEVLPTVVATVREAAQPGQR